MSKADKISAKSQVSAPAPSSDIYSAELHHLTLSVKSAGGTLRRSMPNYQAFTESHFQHSASANNDISPKATEVARQMFINEQWRQSAYLQNSRLRK